MRGTRATGARLGIVAMNLLVPGLGLIRLGRLRPALVILALPIGAFLLLTAVYASSDQLGFTGFVTLIVLAVVVTIASLIVSMLLSWRWSGTQGARPWWTRWYSILGIWVGYLLLSAFSDGPRDHYRTFYMPAEAMEPTLAKNDRLVPAMGQPDRIRRGDLVLVRTGETVYLKRVVGLDGDQIAFRNGRLILNDRPVEQVFDGEQHYTGFDGAVVGRRFRERLPDEFGTHEILDLGPGELDDFEQQVVRPGHLFVLGDNRDRSADSRVPRSMAGLEQVSRADIVGSPRFILWSSDHAKIGRSLRPKTP